MEMTPFLHKYLFPGIPESSQRKFHVYNKERVLSTPPKTPTSFIPHGMDSRDIHVHSLTYMCQYMYSKDPFYHLPSMSLCPYSSHFLRPCVCLLSESPLQIWLATLPGHHCYTLPGCNDTTPVCIVYVFYLMRS